MFTLAQFDTFLFGFDGVVLDSAELMISAFGELYADHGDEARGMVEAYQRTHPGEARPERIAMFHRSLLGEDLNRAEIEAECDRLSRIILEEIADCPLMPDIDETLSVLRAHGISGHIVSNMPQQELEEILSRKSLAHRFRSAHGGPPSREIICEAIFAANRVDRGRCLFIGTSMAEYRCATNIGAHFIGIGDDATSPFPFGTQVVHRLGEAFLEIAAARLGAGVAFSRPIELGRRFRAA